MDEAESFKHVPYAGLCPEPCNQGKPSQLYLYLGFIQHAIRWLATKGCLAPTVQCSHFLLPLQAFSSESDHQIRLLHV